VSAVSLLYQLKALSASMSQVIATAQRAPPGHGIGFAIIGVPPPELIVVSGARMIDRPPVDRCNRVVVRFALL